MDLRRVRWLMAALLWGFAAVGCGADRFIVIGTARAPSTAGFVEVRGSAGSAKVRIEMQALHPVDSLDPSLHAYVVWFEAKNAKPVRAGSLHYRPDDRIGELEATSPFRKFIVKITAEANDKPSAPSAFVVAEQEITVD